MVVVVRAEAQAAEVRVEPRVAGKQAAVVEMRAGSKVETAETAAQGETEGVLAAEAAEVGVVTEVGVTEGMVEMGAEVKAVVAPRWKSRRKVDDATHRLDSGRKWLRWTRKSIGRWSPRCGFGVGMAPPNFRNFRRCCCSRCPNSCTRCPPKRRRC